MDGFINFDVMKLDTVVYKMRDGKGTLVGFAGDRYFCPMDGESLDDYFRERTFPESRVNCKQVLKSLGLTYFDAYEVCKKTHGALVEDLYWIRFEGEAIKYEDVRKSMGRWY